MTKTQIGAHVTSVEKWNPAKDEPDKEIIYIDIASVSQTEKAVNGASRILGVEAPSRARQIVQYGDVLVSTVRPNLNAVAVVPEELQGATASTGFCVLRPNPRTLNHRYLYHWVRSPSFISSMVKRATGQSYPAVTDRVVKQSELPLPRLEEQKRIAAILDQADALCRLRQRAIDRLNGLGQAIFHEMFGDVSRNSFGWKCARLGDLAHNRDGKRVPVKLSDRENMDGEYPYYGASGVIDYVDDYIFDGTFLLIGEDGANLLARSSPIAFMASGKIWVNNHAHVLESNGSASLRYLEYAIESRELRAYVSGSAQPKLTQKSLNNIEIPNPPKSLQDKFEEKLCSIERIRESEQGGLMKGVDAFSTLQYGAFRGHV